MGNYPQDQISMNIKNYIQEHQCFKYSDFDYLNIQVKKGENENDATFCVYSLNLHAGDYVLGYETEIQAEDLE